MTRGLEKKAKKCKLQVFLPGGAVPAEFRSYPYHVIPVDCPDDINRSKAKVIMLSSHRHDKFVIPWAESAAEYFNDPALVKKHNAALETKGGFAPYTFAIFPKPLDAEVIGVAPKSLCHPRALNAFIAFINKGAPSHNAPHHPLIDIRRLIFTPEGTLPERMIFLQAFKKIVGKNLSMLGISEDTLYEDTILKLARFGRQNDVTRIHVFGPVIESSILENMIEAGVSSITTDLPFRLADRGVKMTDVDGTYTEGFKKKGYDRVENIRHNVHVILNKILEIERT